MVELSLSFRSVPGGKTTEKNAGWKKREAPDLDKAGASLF